MILISLAFEASCAFSLVGWVMGC